MLYLIVSFLTLAAGPPLAIAARRTRTTTLALDAFVLVVLGGLVLLHILPEALHSASPLAVFGAGVAAFLLTGAAERSLHRHPHATSHRAMRWLVVGLAMLGLLFHAIVDGAALGGEGDAWAIAVLAHRLPFSMALWWIVAPLFGVRFALAAIGMLAIGTVAGYALATQLVGSATPYEIGIFEGILCGTLLHVVLHADLPPAPQEPRRWLRQLATLAGLIAGVALVWLIESSHAHGGADHAGHAHAGHDHAGHAHGAEGAPGTSVAAGFLRLALESAPALLLAYLAVGALQVWLPGTWLRTTRNRGTLLEALRGVAIGVPLPVCSCGVVPIYRQLVRQGSSAVAAMAFLIATPEIEIAAILLTVELIGPEVAIARVIAAALLAVGVAMVVARLARPASAAVPPSDGCASDASTAAPRKSLGAALRHGFVDAVDETAAWILIGLVLAALLQPHLDPALIAGMPNWIAVPLAAAIGMPLYVCASGSTPLAAVLIASGLSPGAAIAFLLTGPATNVTTFGVLKSQHGAPTARWFAGAMFVGATVCGLAIDAVLPAGVGAQASAALHAEEFGWLAWASLAILGVAVVASVVRRGLRAFLGELFDTPTFAEIQGLDPALSTGGHSHHHPHDHGSGSCRDAD